MKIAPKEKLLEAIGRALERDRQEREMRARQRDLRGQFSELSERENGSARSRRSRPDEQGDRR